MVYFASEGGGILYEGIIQSYVEHLKDDSQNVL